MTFKQTLQLVAVLAVVAGTITIATAQWNPPSGSAPSGNVDAPVHTGSFNQTKLGGLISNFWLKAPLGVLKEFKSGLVNNAETVIAGLHVKSTGEIQVKQAMMPGNVQGMVLTSKDNAGTLEWRAVPSGSSTSTVGLPDGTQAGQVWTWDGATQLWAKPLPDGTANSQVLTWNGTAWVPAAAQGALPAAQNNQVLVYRTQTGNMTGGQVALQTGWQRVNASPVYQINAGCSTAGVGGGVAYMGEISLSPKCYSALCSVNGSSLGYRSCYQAGGSIGAQCNVAFASGPLQCDNSPIRGALVPQ